MATAKTTAHTCRKHPGVKDGLSPTARPECRPIANRVEVQIRDYRGRNGTTTQEQRLPLPDDNHEPHPSKR